MAVRGYEFYLRVLKVSLTSEQSKRVRNTFSTNCLLQNACHKNVMKLGYKVIKEK